MLRVPSTVTPVSVSFIQGKLLKLYECLKKLDVFSFGVLLGKINARLEYEKENGTLDKSLDNDRFLVGFKRLVQNMVHPYYKGRWSAERAYEEYKKLKDAVNGENNYKRKVIERFSRTKNSFTHS